MRILLATAVALAPLMAAAGAQAEIVISNERTTPIRTSNATGSAADDIRLATGGSIEVNTGSAITIDSSHDVDLDDGSSIVMEESADGATGILINGGNTANLTLGGDITITDTADANEDEDEDGDLDGPFATGSNRYGVRVVGPGVLTGNVVSEVGSAILVEGNDSAGVSIETGLNGNVDLRSAITVRGDRSTGVNIAGPVSGDVQILGSVSATGEDASAVDVSGDVAGGVKLQGSFSATGYRYGTRPPAFADFPEDLYELDDGLFLEELDEDDLLQGGPAVQISGNVAGGVLLDRGPAYEDPAGVEGDDDGDGVENGEEDDDGDGTENAEDTDRDGDGILDAQEVAASISSVGGAPALLLGSATEATDIGAVGTGDDAYGVINRGSISASGVYDDVNSTALQLGAGGDLTVQNGVLNSGSIAAGASNGDSVGVRVSAGATTPVIRNEGALSANTGTTGENTATALRIDAGGSLPALVNAGDLTASVTGSAGSATAVHDLSGSLTSITNTGSILAAINPSADEDGEMEEVTGDAVAIDVSANTTGVTLVQDGVQTDTRFIDLEEVDLDTVDTDGDGVWNADEAALVGEVRFGSGADVMDIRNGTVLGTISFGEGADTLSISGGGQVRGAISDTDGLLDISISDGLLETRQSETLNLSGLSVGEDGTLLVAVDPTTGQGGLNVSGTASFDQGASLGARFTTLITEPSQFTLIQAGTLEAEGLDLSGVQENSPYLYAVTTNIDTAGDRITADVRRRTAEELEFNRSETSIYDSVYEGLQANEALAQAILAQTDRDGFVDIYEQLLPDHSGGPLMSLASGVDAVTRALTGRNETAAVGQTSAWIQEINFYADKDKNDTYGFRSEGFGLAGGVERGTNYGNVGLTVAFTSSDLEDPEAAAEENLAANLVELGVYWRAQGQYWTTWARAAAGYAYFDSTRQVVAENINLTNESDWNGYSLAAAAGASYERSFGRYNVRPEAYVEYFRLHEGDRTEFGGGDGFDLEIDERSGHMFTATAAMNIGATFGQDGWIRPELRVGYKQYLSVDAGDTIGRYISGGPDFLLAGGDLEGGGPILGLRLNIGNDLGMLSIHADAEMIDDYVRYALLLRASFRF